MKFLFKRLSFFLRDDIYVTHRNYASTMTCSIIRMQRRQIFAGVTLVYDSVSMSVAWGLMNREMGFKPSPPLQNKSTLMYWNKPEVLISNFVTNYLFAKSEVSKALIIKTAKRHNPEPVSFMSHSHYFKKSLLISSSHLLLVIESFHFQRLFLFKILYTFLNCPTQCSLIIVNTLSNTR
jgi:hypothetical protein